MKTYLIGSPELQDPKSPTINSASSYESKNSMRSPKILKANTWRKVPEQSQKSLGIDI